MFIAKSFAPILGLAFVFASTGFGAVGDFTQDPNGITLQTSGGGLTRVEIWGGKIVRVIHTPATTMPVLSSFSVISHPNYPWWRLTNNWNQLLLKTANLTVAVNSPGGQVSFFTANNNTILAESASGTSLQATTVGSPAVASYITKQAFTIPPGEAIYGLGQHPGGVMNWVGHSTVLQQKNMDVGIPVLLSNKGYSLLWDNPSVTTIDVGKTAAGVISWSSEAGNAVDYYFCYGPRPDTAIAGYRALTGAAPMFGRWAWGFWQCKDAYATQEELLGIAAHYRSLNIPIDGIIQDAGYWRPYNRTTATGGCGSHQFDPARYPDPAGMMDTLHSEHFHVLISVWPSFELSSTGVSIPDLRQLASVHGVFSQAIASWGGPSKWLDPYSAAARRVFWTEMAAGLFSKGVDGWWLDASEPELSTHWGEMRNLNTTAGSGAIVYNAYPLMETKAVYDGQRAQTFAYRVITLTRSSYAGQQRNAAITWSGDIHGDWTTLTQQVPNGLNFTAAGVPYWNTDIGGFTFGNPPSDPGYAELFTRWFQFGAFCPMFRVHGVSYPKEVWRFPAATQSVLIDTIKLRYRLLPYIYSIAWQVTNASYTMMRPLVMDFQNDPAINGIGNQFMFGPAMMVSPVTTQGVIARTVYLPVGADWIDFWTGSTLAGGQSVTASAPIGHLPIYVRTGSIVPLGPNIQYAMQSLDPIELRVYPGANGRFTLYEDEGDNYDYERGTYATIPFSWNDAAQQLTIGARQGSFPGMLARRSFRIVFVRPGQGIGLYAPADVTVLYDGSARSVTRPAGPRNRQLPAASRPAPRMGRSTCPGAR